MSARRGDAPRRLVPGRHSADLPATIPAFDESDCPLTLFLGSLCERRACAGGVGRGAARASLRCRSTAWPTTNPPSLLTARRAGFNTKKRRLLPAVDAVARVPHARPPHESTIQRASCCQFPWRPNRRCKKHVLRPSSRVLHRSSSHFTRVRGQPRPASWFTGPVRTASRR